MISAKLSLISKNYDHSAALVQDVRKAQHTESATSYTSCKSLFQAISQMKLLIQ